MHNFFTIEVGAEMRRQEAERAAAADARAAQASSLRRSGGWLSRAFGSRASLPAPAGPATPVAALLELPRVPRPVAC